MWILFRHKNVVSFKLNTRIYVVLIYFYLRSGLLLVLGVSSCGITILTEVKDLTSTITIVALY